MSGQPQFRYTQTPSKVLHLRNLPWECGEEELIELCKPFGKVVNTKCCVGANRNQAFVEFVRILFLSVFYLFCCKLLSVLAQCSSQENVRVIFIFLKMEFNIRNYSMDEAHSFAIV